MYVCMCYGVTDSDIKQAVSEHGVGNLRELVVSCLSAAIAAVVYKWLNRLLIRRLSMSPYSKTSVDPQPLDVFQLFR